MPASLPRIYKRFAKGAGERSTGHQRLRLRRGAKTTHEGCCEDGKMLETVLLCGLALQDDLLDLGELVALGLTVVQASDPSARVAQVERRVGLRLHRQVDRVPVRLSHRRNAQPSVLEFRRNESHSISAAAVLTDGAQEGGHGQRRKVEVGVLVHKVRHIGQNRAQGRIRSWTGSWTYRCDEDP